MSKEKKNNIDKTKKETLDLKEFMLLDTKKQSEKIESILKEMYEDSLDVTKKYVEKVLNITFDIADNEIYLPNSLKVEKKGSKLIFSFKEKNNWGLILLFLLAFLFIGGAATYSGYLYLSIKDLNIDLDDDGVADINIDVDDDGICDINCDTDKDNKPNKNIDYQGNRKATFNVLREDESIFNKVNQDIDNDGKCDINCDSDDDGWPDYNIDLDGDGILDINIDIDGDGKPDLNIDINGDGVADVNIDNDGDGKCDANCVSNKTGDKELNIDKDGDGKCDVNCDTNDDSKPDKNIDYDGNKEPIFNKEDENGNINNKMNQDTNGDGKCDINCDTDDDGWPDTNIDLDGDGKADINIDNDKDGNPDLNIDNDGDGKCDLNCDEDGDGICDTSCALIVTKNDTTSYEEQGNGGTSASTSIASLLVVFENKNKVVTENIYPDDQPESNLNTKVPSLKFTVTNQSDRTLYYDLKWIIEKNTFTTNNFWYKVESNNSGYNKEWGTAPFKDETIKTSIAIAPGATQSYTISMTLHGTGTAQNEDQGRAFSGKIQVLLNEQ